VCSEQNSEIETKKLLGPMTGKAGMVGATVASERM
jgi:hypothetical protein